MKTYKGYGGSISIDNDALHIKSALFIKESCTFNDIESVEFIEPTLLENGYIQIKTPKHHHTVFFLKKKRDLFMELYELIQHNCNLINKNFSPTKNFPKIISFDDNNKLFKYHSGLKCDTQKYDDILGFELIENGQNIIDGNTGKTLIGGILGGTTGAIIGSSGDRSISATVDDITILIRMNNTKNPTIKLQILDRSVERNSRSYSIYSETAQDIISYLTLIVNKNNSTNLNADYDDSTSTVDEIRQYKQLLDEGIITQQEFDAKKKQLLNL